MSFVAFGCLTLLFFILQSLAFSLANWTVLNIGIYAGQYIHKNKTPNEYATSI